MVRCRSGGSRFLARYSKKVEERGEAMSLSCQQQQESNQRSAAQGGKGASKLGKAYDD